MESIKDILPKSKLVRTLQFKQKWLNQGFTQVSNRLLTDNSISSGAFRMYLLLMMRCFRKSFSYPGVETLAKELNVSRMTISTYKKELKESGWIEVKRRGQGKTDIYFLLKH